MVILCTSHTKFRPESKGYFSEIVLNIPLHQPPILNTSNLHKEYYFTVNINNKVRIRMDKKHEHLISISYW